MFCRPWLLFFLFALAGCAGPGAIGAQMAADGTATSTVRAAGLAGLPAPEVTDQVSGYRPYLIGPFDKLVIDVFGVEELHQKEVQTDASGRISFPIAGTVAAAGKTPAELEVELARLLRAKYIRDPQVTVNLTEAVSQVVAVNGEVREPGLYPVLGKMTLMRAVARAKGLTQDASSRDVVVFRTVGGQKMAGLYNLGAIQRGNYDDPEIYANDVVVVGQSGSRQLFTYGIAAFSAIVTPLIYVLTRR